MTALPTRTLTITGSKRGWKLHRTRSPLTESVLGWRQLDLKDPGWARALEKVGSSLTSPLSLGLFAAFAPAGLAEGVAGTALKEGLTKGSTLLGEEALDAGNAALKVENYGKAVAAAKKAQVAGTSIQDAVASATGDSMPYQEFINFGQYLRNQGMTESDILSEGLARRVASRGLYAAGFGPEKALSIAKGAETFVNAGFAWQQVQGAVYALPHFADALANGDYDHAQEYLVEGGLGGVFGLLGGAHALHSISDIVPGINEKNALSLSDEIENVKRMFGRAEGAKGATLAQITEQHRQQMVQMLELAELPVPAGLRTGGWDQVGLLKEIGSAVQQILTSKADRERLSFEQMKMFFRLDTGNDPVAAHQMLRSLAYAANQERWVQENLPGYEPPVRGIEHIQNEEERSNLAAKRDVEESKTNLKNLADQIQGTREAIQELNPETEENRPRLQQELQNLQQQETEAQIKHPELLAELRRAELWKQPAIDNTFKIKDLTEQLQKAKEDKDKKADIEKQLKPLIENNGKLIPETPEEKSARLEKAFRSRYDFMTEELNKARRTSLTLDEFNQKVRALGNYPQDLAIIEEKYPQFRFPERPPANAIIFLGHTRMFRMKSIGEKNDLKKKRTGN